MDDMNASINEPSICFQTLLNDKMFFFVAVILCLPQRLCNNANVERIQKAEIITSSIRCIQSNNIKKTY